jgi:fibronectin type 3 domain-containing protein
VAVGSISNLSVTLTNSSTSTVTILNVSISGPGFAIYGLPNGLILGSDEATTFYVIFSPTGVGPVAGSITITSNAANFSLPIMLSGSGGQPAPHFVTLSWTASTSSVVGYYVYRATQTGGPYMMLNSTPVVETRYIDFTATAGQTYFYVVGALDSSNVQSTYSNEVSVTAP